MFNLYSADLTCRHQMTVCSLNKLALQMSGVLCININNIGGGMPHIGGQEIGENTCIVNLSLSLNNRNINYIHNNFISHAEMESFH